MNFNKIRKGILKEINSVKVEDKNIDKLCSLILDKKEIFLMGAGRSGLVADMFAIRLRNLGLKSFVVGDVTSSKIDKNDLLIAVSGSGETKITYAIVKDCKAEKVLITADKNSKIAKISDLIIQIKVPRSKQPLRSLFEQSCLIFLDSLVLYLMKKTKKSKKYLEKRHVDL